MARLSIALVALLAGCGEPRQIQVSRVAVTAKADCTADCPRPLPGLPVCGPAVQVSDDKVTAPSNINEDAIDGAYELSYRLTLSDSDAPLQPRKSGLALQGQPVSVTSIVRGGELYHLRADGTVTVVDTADLVEQVDSRLAFRYQSDGATVTEVHQIHTETMPFETSDSYSGPNCCASAGGRPMLAMALASAALLLGRRRARSAGV